MALSATQPCRLQCRAIVREIEDAGADIRILRLQPQEEFTYKAGQYIDISFGGLPPRPYSIAAAPGSGLLEIHIKRGKGPASLYALDRLNRGEEITFSGPAGHSWFDESRAGPVIAIAGGLGAAPLKAIAEQAMKAQTPPPFTLYWGTSTAAERYLEQYFLDMAGRNAAFRYRPVIGDHVGGVALKEIGDCAAFHIYISGPPAMISALIPPLLAKGARRDKISYDRHPEAAKVKS